MIAMTWICQCSWGSNHLYISIESMNIFPCVARQFVIRSSILVAINALSLSIFYNAFMYWKRNLIVDTFSPEKISSCWILIVMLLKYSSCYLLLNVGVVRSDWTSLFIPPVGTNEVIKFALYGNFYYNWKKIYWKFIHVKGVPCHISGMTSRLSRLDKIQVIAIIASGDHFYRMI